MVKTNNRIRWYWKKTLQENLPKENNNYRNNSNRSPKLFNKFGHTPSTIFLISSQNPFPSKSFARFIASTDIVERILSSFTRYNVFSSSSDSVFHKKPLILSSTISFWPPALNTTGTTPAPIASTVDIPKCSANSGCFSKSSPYPDACQYIFALE